MKWNGNRPVAFILFSLCIGLALAWASESRAQNVGKAKKIVSVEGITEYRLGNGVRYLLFPDKSAAKVTVNMTVFVGSRHEGYGETGMAHLLEHMLFKGCKGFPDVDKALQEHGARANGTTWVDRTNYYETMPATDDNLKFGIMLEADRLVKSFIRREDLAKEMTVVRNEFEIGENDPQGILSQRMMATAFEWHNYGKSTIGNRSDIERVPIENLRTFYRKFYQPDNIMLVIAGKFDQKKAHKYMGTYFGGLKAPERKLRNTYTEEPPQDGERIVILRRVGTVSVVGAIYHTPAAAHPECAAVQVLESVLTSAPSGRLYKALVETKKATDVGGFAPAWHDPSILEILSTVGDTSTPEEVRKIMLDVMENLAKNPITPQEVERARRRQLAQWERAFTNSSRIGIQISEWAGAGDWRMMFLHRDRIKAVTAKQVNEVAKKYLIKSNRTVGIFYPTKQVVRATVPQSPSIQELVKNYKGGKEIAKGEAFDPTPENIEKRLKRLKLSNGLKVAFLQKKTRGQKVVASMTIRFGNEKSLNGKTEAAGFVGAMLTRGTNKYTRQEFKDELDKLKASLSINSGMGSLSVSIQAKHETLPAVLDLLEEALRRPAFPKVEFDILKRNNMQALKKGLTDPVRLAVTSWRRKTNPFPMDSIHYVPSIPEAMQRLEKVTLQQVKQLYKTQLGATVGELAVVGDFEPEIVTASFEKMLAGWDSEVPFRRIPTIANVKVPGSKDSIVTPDKKNAIFIAGYQLKMKDTSPQYPAMEFGNYVLGSAGLNSLIFDRLRTQEGLSYGAGSQFGARALDDYGVFMIFAFCNPANIEKVNSSTLDVLNTAHKNGISNQQLEEFRKGYLLKQKVGRSSDGALAGTLSADLFLNRTFGYYADLESKIAKLSVSDVNNALRQLIATKRLVIVRAGDFRTVKE